MHQKNDILVMRVCYYLHLHIMYVYIIIYIHLCVRSRGHIFVCVREKYACVQRGQALIT